MVSKHNVPEEETTILVPNINIKTEDENVDDDSETVLPTRLFSDIGPNVTPDNQSKSTKGILVPVSGAGEKTYIVTKVHKRKTKLEVQQKVNSKLDSLVSECVVNDTPLFSVTARNIRVSDLLFLELKEIEDEEEEPLYQCFGYNPKLCVMKSCFDLEGDYKKNCACQGCEFTDVCDEYRFGSYCVTAVKRYYEENKFFATLKDAYIVYVSHYNRALDLHSFNKDNESAGMRDTQVTKPPHCMQEGSLKHSLHWVKWSVENGSEKAYYRELRIRKKRAKVMKMAKESTYNSYRFVRNKDSE